jgi:hypothetical protein
VSTKRKTTPRTGLREDVGSDPHWVNWEYLAAFGEDERGFTFVAAVKQYCCAQSDEEEWLEQLVKRARVAFDRAGHGATGLYAACRVLRAEGGMVILHDLMADLGVGLPRNPRLAFRWQQSLMTVVVNWSWKVTAMPD